MTSQADPPFSVEVEAGVAVVVCHWPYYLGEDGREELREHLDGLIASGCRRIVLDLGRVVDWNSPGFEAEFLRAWNQLRRVGGRLGICSLHADKRAMFAIMRWDRLLEFHADRLTAIAALGAGERRV